MASNLFKQLNPQSSSSFQGGTPFGGGTQTPGAINGINPEMVRSVKRMMNMVRGMQNPQQVLEMAAQQNPQMAAVLNMINGSGMSPKQLFYQMAQQNGVDPQSIINMLSQP